MCPRCRWRSCWTTWRPWAWTVSALLCGHEQLLGGLVLLVETAACWLACC